jgi:transposase InsO family protein
MARSLIMDLQDARAAVKYLIRDRDTKFTTALDAVLAGEGIETIQCAVRVPRMNSTMERWVLSYRREILDRTLHSAAPLRAIPEPMTDPHEIDHLRVHRQDRLAGILHEHAKAA